MLDVSPLIELLGHSEKDVKVSKMLTDFGIKTPLKRPKRGEDQVNFETESGVEFCFVDAESFENFSDEHAEGELIFSTLFIFPSRFEGKEIKLPFDLTLNLTREAARKKLGPPEEDEDDSNDDLWSINDIKIFISFDDNQKSITEINFSSDLIIE